MSGRGPRPLAVAAIISVFCVAAGAVFLAKMRERTGGHLSLPLDDGYIYLQYARRLAEGHFLSYSEGAAPSTGASSWAHMMLLSTAFLAGLDGEDAIWASLAFGAVYLGLSLWLSFRLVRALAAGPAAGWWGAGAAAV